MGNREFGLERAVNTGLAYSLTAARLFIAYNMAKRVEAGRNITLPMAAFVGADIMDGVIARKLDVDSPGRRFADALVDRVSVGMVARNIVKEHPQTRPYVIGIGLREAAVSAANMLHYANSGEVVQGTGVHKLGTLSLAAFGIISSYGHYDATRVAGTVASSINIGLALDYIRNAVNPTGDTQDGIRKISFDKSTTF